MLEIHQECNGDSKSKTEGVRKGPDKYRTGNKGPKMYYW